MTTMTELETPEARDVGTLVATLDIRTLARGSTASRPTRRAVKPSRG